MTQLHEDYRPKTYGEVVGQDTAIKVIQRQQKRNGSLAGRAYWLSGLSGSGKTTLAKLIAQDVADDQDIAQVVGRELSKDDLRKLWTRGGMFCNGAKQGRALIVDEAHGLKSPTIEYLLGVLEKDGMPDHAVIVFTTRLDPLEFFENKGDGPALLSRCMEIALRDTGLNEPFAVRAREIAISEGLDNGAPIEAYRDLVSANACNMRAVLTKIEAGVMLDWGDGNERAASRVQIPKNTKQKVAEGVSALDQFLSAQEQYAS